jgi:metal-sulfur cluster biosynthetic enzyme
MAIKKTKTKKSKAKGTGKTTNTDAAKQMNVFKENLKKIIDPHTGINILDMNMVQNIVYKNGKIALDFIPTSPFCPVVNYFIDEMKKAAKHAGFSDCEVKIKV